MVAKLPNGSFLSSLGSRVGVPIIEVMLVDSAYLGPNFGNPHMKLQGHQVLSNVFSMFYRISIFSSLTNGK